MMVRPAFGLFVKNHGSQASTFDQSRNVHLCLTVVTVDDEYVSRKWAGSFNSFEWFHLAKVSEPFLQRSDYLAEQRNYPLLPLYEPLSDFIQRRWTDII